MKKNLPKFITAKLVRTLADLVIWFGIKCRSVFERITWFGFKMKDKSFMMDTRTHQSFYPGDEVKDAIIAVSVKKGGCEVQSGCFRRIDCEEETK